MGQELSIKTERNIMNTRNQQKGRIKEFIRENEFFIVYSIYVIVLTTTLLLLWK